MNPKLAYISSSKKGEPSSKVINRIEQLEKSIGQLKKSVDMLRAEVQGLKGTNQ